MKNLRKTVYLVLGVAIGAWELYVGAISILMIFFFKEIEPWSSCLMVVFGPLVTLPAIVFGIRHPRASGISLCCGASLALLSIGISEGLHGENLLGVALYVSGPMYLFGFLNLLRSYQK